MHERRKHEHLQICLDTDVRSGVTNGLERYHLVHQALPEMALDDVDPSTTFLNHALQAPLLISAMTGGTAAAGDINRRLAAAAQALGVAMGLIRSARARRPYTDVHLWVRDVAPT